MMPTGVTLKASSILVLTAPAIFLTVVSASPAPSPEYIRTHSRYTHTNLA